MVSDEAYTFRGPPTESGEEGREVEKGSMALFKKVEEEEEENGE